MALESGWSSLRADDTWHATYWIAEWPRVEVSSEFLGPLLLGSVRRSVSVVMEPLARRGRCAGGARAHRRHRRRELRSRGGFLATARRSRESDLVVQREAELADGHGAFRFSGYVTVTARSELLLGAPATRPNKPRGSAGSSCAACSVTRSEHSSVPSRWAGDCHDAASPDAAVLVSQGTPMSGRAPKLPAHQITTANLGAAYPLLAEAGLVTVVS